MRKSLKFKEEPLVCIGAFSRPKHENKFVDLTQTAFAIVNPRQLVSELATIRLTFNDNNLTSFLFTKIQLKFIITRHILIREIEIIYFNSLAFSKNSFFNLASASNARNKNDMRRSNYSYQPLPQQPSTSRAALNPDALEEENELQAEELKEKIGALKSLTIDIGNEVRYQDKLLRGIDDDMDRTGGFLSNTMSRVLRLGRSGGHHKHMCYMFLFVMFVFLLLYVVLKLR